MSKIAPGTEIAVIVNALHLTDYRFDLCDPLEPLQVSGRCLEAGVEVPAHRHNPIVRETKSTMESWIIFSGSVECDIYDLDDCKLDSKVLHGGDCLVLFRGGHSLRVIEDRTIMFEFKNGPYLGSDRDKENI